MTTQFGAPRPGDPVHADAMLAIWGQELVTPGPPIMIIQVCVDLAVEFDEDNHTSHTYYRYWVPTSKKGNLTAATHVTLRAGRVPAGTYHVVDLYDNPATRLTSGRLNNTLALG